MAIFHQTGKALEAGASRDIIILQVVWGVGGGVVGWGGKGGGMMRWHWLWVVRLLDCLTLSGV